MGDSVPDYNGAFGDGIHETTEYDAYGNKTAFTDRNGNTTANRYDAHGLMVEKCSPGSLVATYAYDADGNLTEESDNTGAHRWYAYDDAGYLTEERELLCEKVCRSIRYTHDAYGRMLSVTDALGNTSVSISHRLGHAHVSTTTDLQPCNQRGGGAHQ